MKAADGEESNVVPGVEAGRRWWVGGYVDSESPQNDLGGVDLWVMGEQVLAIEFRDCEAGDAFSRFYVEISAVHKEVGSVQSEAEADSKQTRRYHRHPRCEVPVMGMNVLNALPGQPERITGSKPGVGEGVKALPGSFVALQKDSL